MLGLTPFVVSKKGVLSLLRTSYVERLWFIYLAFVFLAIDGFYAVIPFKAIAEHVQFNMTKSEYFRQSLYLFVYLLTFVIIYISSRLKKRYGIVVILTSWVLATIELAFYFIHGHTALLSEVVILNAAAANLTDALKEYSYIVFKSVALTSFLFVPLLIKIIFNKKVIGLVGFILPVIFLACIYLVILIFRGELTLSGFPRGFSYGFGSISSVANEMYQKSQGDLYAVKVKTNQSNAMDKIIVIVDESVEYDEFSKLPSLKSPFIIDYGRAYSAANCSAASNYIIRQATWFPQETKNNELIVKNVDSLFSLAKKNGYRTAYFDNQNTLKDTMGNSYFTDTEISNIDSIFDGEGPAYSRDSHSLKMLNSLIADNAKLFVLINKIGSHFPYEDTIEPKLRTGNRMADYKTSISKNSRDYLAALVNLLDDNTIVFYTSDHGQDFKHIATHCKLPPKAVLSEYSVPFFVLSKNTNLIKKLHLETTEYNNKLTHLEFSESVRNALGYDVDGVASIYTSSPALGGNFCGLYGYPKSFFGHLPRCQVLN